jgi:type I restriction enzyme, S subunit
MSSEWEEVTVGDISILVTKGTTPTTLGFGFETRGIRFVKVETLTEDGHFIEDKFAFISEEANKALLRSQLQEEDILFTIAGTIGRTGIVKKKHLPANTNQAVAIIRPNRSLIEPRYLRYVLSNPAFTRTAQSKTVQSVQANFSLGELKKAKFQLPHMAMQREILSVLGTLDDRITLLRETNTTLEAIALALFKSWFVDFDPVHAKMQGRAPEGMDEATAALFPDSFEESELKAMPKGWRIGTLSDLASFQNGYAFKSKDWSEAGHPVIKIGNVKPSLISFDGCSFVDAESVVGLDRFKLKRGDLLVGMTGYVGETGLVTEVSPAAYLNQRVGRIATSAGVKDLGFIFCLTRHEDFKAFAEGQSHGSAQANVSGSDLLKFKSVIPDNKVIRAFNDLIETFIESIMLNHEQAKLLGELRDTLLPRLIFGQLSVNQATVESEA